MARHAAGGDSVHILILAEGAMSRDDGRDTLKRRAELDKLRLSAVNAAKAIGAQSPKLAGLPDNRMDSCDLLDVVKIVEQTIENLSPDIIYTHHMGDLNIDHRITCQAVMTAARPIPGSSLRRILFFEVPSSTGWAVPDAANAFIPNCFIDIADFLPRKLDALSHYAGEMRKWPHARSIEAVCALAKWRGAIVGRDAAEAFVIGRDLIG